jgi:acyl carrier protein
VPATVTVQQVESRIFEVLASLGPEPEDIEREADLASLDIDSLDLVELSQVVEDEMGVKLEADDVQELQTVGDVIDLVMARAS